MLNDKPALEFFNSAISDFLVEINNIINLVYFCLSQYKRDMW